VEHLVRAAHDDLADVKFIGHATVIVVYLLPEAIEVLKDRSTSRYNSTGYFTVGIYIYKYIHTYTYIHT
jgi:hypothetical protein